ncbi:permease [uncultured Sphaerochaeta sp.]|uniref:permease n=1 Tax=uncultured Sphaerochaeta sp. TaxID=886478 RepID=UPI002A0A68CD|nr:permease [uncultured Sphaerochaeta sp.]
MTTLVKRYSSFLLVLVLLGILSLFNQELGAGVFNITVMQLKEMLLVLPPIFVLLGLLDVWVPKQTMVRYMGKGSGLKGILLSLFIGSAAAGPLYGAFPVAAVFMKKGVTFSNVLIFIGAWSTTKIPMILFEFSALGAPFTLTRLLIDIPGIIIIAFLLSKMMGKEEIEAIYEKASKQ